MTHTRLPKTYPQSLRLRPKEPPSALAKARVHERKAERVRDDDEGKGFQEYLERFAALQACADDHTAKARRELAYRLGHDQPGPHEVVGHLIASLPAPRLKLLFQNDAISALNLILSKRMPPRLIGENELLDSLDITPQAFLSARKDLRFQLGLQGYKSAQAVALYLFVVRAAVDPKVKKQVSLVKDDEVLAPANTLLREVVTHVVEHLQITHDAFFQIGNRALREKGLPRGPKA